jgi:hypothetical protein
MAHPPKRGKRAQKKGAFGPFRPKKVAALIIWHECLSSGLLVEISCQRAFKYVTRRPRVKNSCQRTAGRLLPWVPGPPQGNLGIGNTFGRPPNRGPRLFWLRPILANFWAKKAQNGKKTALAGMAHPPKRGKPPKRGGSLVPKLSGGGGKGSKNSGQRKSLRSSFGTNF